MEFDSASIFCEKWKTKFHGITYSDWTQPGRVLVYFNVMGFVFADGGDRGGRGGRGDRGGFGGRGGRGGFGGGPGSVSKRSVSPEAEFESSIPDIDDEEEEETGEIVKRSVEPENEEEQIDEASRIVKRAGRFSW